ncbi:hypothetical protein [Variovorax boronicumulans]|uniref:hypothetical protein n=1 Tax=Variovorax boronicumulans TaxID=436515 RepID=UPI002785DF57|nr:hypothetical protein [Variovorax boronicumulans]MDQ0040805.1 hypothetical protein [Variovorax boronicumulans]
MNTYCIVMQRHLERTDERYLAWFDRIAKLEKADAGAFAVCSAQLSHFTGDVREMEDFIAVARKAGLLVQPIRETQLMGYVNLTFATKAQGVFRQAVDVRYGNIASFIQMGTVVGAFQGISELATQAEKANLSLSAVQRLPSWLRAAEVLREQDFSDEQCAQVMDLVGEVLRADKLFWLDAGAKVSIDEGQGVVLVRLRVATTPIHAADMTTRVVEKLIDKGLDSAPLLVNFVGTQH